MSDISKFGLAFLCIMTAFSPRARSDAGGTADLAKLCPEKEAAFTPQLVNPELSAKLLDGSRTRILVVGYESCGIRLLENCTLPGQYRFTAVNRTRLTEYLLNRRDLFSKLPFDATGLDPLLRKGGSMSLNQALVGFYEAPASGAGRDQLKGDCKGATHIVGKFEMGAFVLQTKTMSGSGPTVAELNKAGVLERCLLGTTDAESDACRAILKLYLAPVSGGPAMPVSSPHPLLQRLPGPARARRLESGSFGKSIALPEPGKATVILFWSPASPRSIAALGALEELSRKFDRNRVQAIGVAVDTNPLTAQNAISGLPITFPLAIDDGSLKRRYQTTGNLAEIFVLDHEGYVRFYADGDRTDLTDAAAAVRALAPD